MSEPPDSEENTARFPGGRRWHVDRSCPSCGGALRFLFSSIDDWDDINIVFLGPPTEPQTWTCPHCRAKTTESFDAYLGHVRKPRKARALNA